LLPSIGNAIRNAAEGDLIKLAEILIAFAMLDAPAAKDALSEANLRKYIDYLGEDMGIFSGCYARSVFAQTLADSMPPGPNGPRFDATFQEHYDYFQTDLVLMGTNLSTQKSVEFSVANTPNFPVADAVRISMGIPLAFKPVVIPDGNLQGVWVDGGVANNAPFRVFDNEPGDNPKTLVLRLDVEPPPQKIEGLFSFLGSYANFAFRGVGEAAISEQYANQTIVIDTGRLSLLNFTPDPTISDPAVENARSATRQYLNQSPGQKSAAGT
jgi:predicted acylesterase/phospholipase RssA